MKIRNIPQEYESMQFKGETKEFDDFIACGHAKLNKIDGNYYLTCWLGNRGLDIGDYVYKHGQPLTMIGIAHNDTLFDRYFEVVK